jgi:nitrogen fixation NifU-like protein
MDLYAENILDHYRHPRNQEPLPDPTVSHEEANLSCGDTLQLQLRLENGTVTGISWQGLGCAISQASMSLLSEEIVGKSADELRGMGKSEVYALLGVPVGPRRYKCALLSLHTLKNTLRKAEGLEPQSWLQTVELSEN